MSEQGKTRGLSEISHLFLSSVRNKHTNGAAGPTRRPPGSFRPQVSIDMTPEEFAQAAAAARAEKPAAAAARAETSAAAVAEADEPQRVPPVKAIIAAHLGSRQLECVKRYARCVAAMGRRVGLIVIDAGELRLMRFDPQSEGDHEQVQPSDTLDARAMLDSINEMNCDLDCWLLAAGNPRLSEARALLRDIERWVLLSTCEHEGVVACYRTLKGLADLHLGGSKLTLAALDAKDPAEAQTAQQRLSAVCQQFLNWKVDAEPAVADAPHVGEATVMLWQATHDKAQLAAGAHWDVATDLLQRARGSDVAEEKADEPVMPAAAAEEEAMEPPMTMKMPRAEEEDRVPGSGRRVPDRTEPGARSPEPETGSVGFNSPTNVPEVLELPTGDAGDEVILQAVLKHSMGEVIECPIRPPMCPEARLAVGRDRRIVLIAVARHGLAELKSIGKAYQWAMENRMLLSMAMPQFALDAHELPHLRLLVDQADANADVLQPMFHVETVRIQTYRRVRWGQRTGLLLDAA